MDLHLDLHSHSGYAGGVGKTSFDDVERNMPLKGIHVVGTGDCLYPAWLNKLRDTLQEEHTGLFSYAEGSPVSYVLQTEIILTADIGPRRKGVHTVLLFPSFDAVDKAVLQFEAWGMKNTVGRPFLCCKDKFDVSKKIETLLDIDDLIEVVPAHVMTPEGVFGSKAPIDSLQDFYGESAERISIIETGLSADPQVLSLIPEFDRMSLISNSDAHSPALNRMGREFTSVSTHKDYPSILSALRKNHILGTAEFNPVEGRYFLTGHRSGRRGHEGHYCIFSPKNTPPDAKCPICGKQLTIGVMERALQLSAIQGEGRDPDDVKPKKPFVHMVPLTEIIAYSLGIISVSSKKVYNNYIKITSIIDECDLWFEDQNTIRRKLSGIVDDKLLENILSVKRGEFCFYPAGYDGEYGTLRIGTTMDYEDVHIIK
ncbi:MAG: endonuclease Q family protein [Candidatus Methanofastidiosia archaeon]